MQSGHALQALYDSEINFSISCFWDGGFNWALGDEMNGVHDSGNEDTFGEALVRLVDAALDRYPDSAFAIRWRAQGIEAQRAETSEAQAPSQDESPVAGGDAP